MKFPRFGFRRNTHKQDEQETFNREELNIWQLHMWKASLIKMFGSTQLKEILPVNKAVAFDDILLGFKKFLKPEELPDREEIAEWLLKMVECGLILVEKADDYETTLYDEGVKFWDK
jgi:hypothetical protein